MTPLGNQRSFQLDPAEEAPVCFLSMECICEKITCGSVTFTNRIYIYKSLQNIPRIIMFLYKYKPVFCSECFLPLVCSDLVAPCSSRRSGEAAVSTPFLFICPTYSQTATCVPCTDEGLCVCMASDNGVVPRCPRYWNIIKAVCVCVCSRQSQLKSILVRLCCAPTDRQQDYC